MATTVWQTYEIILTEEMGPPPWWVQERARDRYDSADIRGANICFRCTLIRQRSNVLKVRQARAATSRLLSFPTAVIGQKQPEAAGGRNDSK